MHFNFSNHALIQMRRRGIKEELITDIIHNPDKIVEQDEELSVYSKVVNEDSKVYLYRVFLNHVKEPKVVVTVYKTSKLEKYGYSI